MLRPALAHWLPPSRQRAAALALVLAGLVILLATTLLGVGRGKEPPGIHDFVYMYAGGETWRRGLNPYDHATIRAVAQELYAGRTDLVEAAASIACPFAYPPTAAAPLALLASLELDTARVVFLVLNFASLAALVAVFLWAWGSPLAHTTRTAPRAPALSSLPPRLPDTLDRPATLAILAMGLVVAYTLANPFTSHNIWMGQTSLVALALLAGSWWAMRTDRHALAGILAALASFKISLGVFFLVWFLIEGRWRSIVAGVLAGLVLVAWPAWHTGVTPMLTTWFNAMAEYKAFPGNQPTFRHILSLQSVLWSLGLHLPDAIFKALGVALFIAVAILRSRLTALERFAISLAIPIVFVHGHDYDAVAALPLLVACFHRARHSPAWLVLLCVVCVALAVPMRLVDAPGLNPIERWRDATITLMLLAFVALALLRPTPAQSPAQA